MSIPWAEITDEEIAEGIPPSASLFNRLRNNPRAVLYGDVTVPYLKRILAEGTQDPATGFVGAHILSDGSGGIECGPPIGTPTHAVRISVTTPTVLTATEFPITGLYTLTLLGGGGGGSSTAAPASGYGSRYNGGGAGGYVRALVFIDVSQTLPTVMTGAGGAADVNGGDSYVVAANNSWRIDSFGGKAGLPLAGFPGLGKGGKASITGFAQGFAVPGGTSRMGLGGRSGQACYGSIGDEGRGGVYQGAGKRGVLLIQRGAFA